MSVHQTLQQAPEVTHALCRSILSLYEYYIIYELVCQTHAGFYYSVVIFIGSLANGNWNLILRQMPWPLDSSQVICHLPFQYALWQTYAKMAASNRFLWSVLQNHSFFSRSFVDYLQTLDCNRRHVKLCLQFLHMRNQVQNQLVRGRQGLIRSPARCTEHPRFFFHTIFLTKEENSYFFNQIYRIDDFAYKHKT